MLKFRWHPIWTIVGYWFLLCQDEFDQKNVCQIQIELVSTFQTSSPNNNNGFKKQIFFFTYLYTTDFVVSFQKIMTKVKCPPEEKIYDDDGFWLRAACVCVKDQSETEVSWIFFISKYNWHAVVLKNCSHLQKKIRNGTCSTKFIL